MDWKTTARIDTSEPDCRNIESLVKSKEAKQVEDSSKRAWVAFSIARQLALWGLKCLNQELENPDEFPLEQEEIIMKNMKYRIEDLKPDLIKWDNAALRRLGLILREYDTRADVAFKKDLMSSLQTTYSSMYETLKKKLSKSDAKELERDPVVDEYKPNPNESNPIDEYLKLEKDVNSLTRINSNIQQFLQESEEGKLVKPGEYDFALQRLFHVAGEFLKQTDMSPNLSAETRESLMRKGVPVDALGEYRDMLAHYQMFSMIETTDAERKGLEETWRGVKRILANEIADLEGNFFEEIIKKNTKDSMKRKVEALMAECEIKSVACLGEKVKSRMKEADWQDTWNPTAVMEITRYEERMKSQHFPEHTATVNNKFELIPDTKKAIVDFIIDSKRKLYDEMHEALEESIDEYPLDEKVREKIKGLLHQHENDMEIIKVQDIMSHGGSTEGLEAFFSRLPGKSIVTKKMKIIKVKEELKKYLDANEFVNNSGDWILPNDEKMYEAKQLLEGTGEQGKKVMGFLNELRTIKTGDVTDLKPKDYEKAVGSLKNAKSQGKNKVLSEEQAAKLYSVSLQWRKDECAKLLNYYLDVMPLYNEILGNSRFLKKIDIDVNSRQETLDLSTAILPIAADLFDERVKEGISAMLPLENPSALESQVFNVVELLKRKQSISDELEGKPPGKRPNSGESVELETDMEGDIMKFRNYLSHGDALATVDEEEQMTKKLVDLKDGIKGELDKIVEGGEKIDFHKIGDTISRMYPEGALAIKNILCPYSGDPGKRRHAREVESCLTWEDIEEVVDDREGPIDPDNIKIDSEKMMDVLVRESQTNEAKFQNYVALATESEMKGPYENELVLVIHHDETFGKHLENVEAFSGAAMHGMMAKNILGELLRGDYKDVAVDVSFLGGSFLLGEIAKTAAKKGAMYALEGSSALGGSLQLASPLLARGASVFVAYDLYNQIKALESGDKDAIVNVVGDGIQLAVDTAEVGVEIAEGLSLVEGVSAVTGPIGMAIGATVFVGTEIYKSVKAVQNIEKNIRLNGLEKFNEGLRSFIGMNPSDYINSIIEVKQGNNAAVEHAKQFLRNNTNIQRYIFPSYEQDDDCYEPISALNSTVSLAFEMKDVELSRSSPDSVPQVDIFCKPKGKGGGVFKGWTNLCTNAIGVEYVDDRTDSYTLINMGRGHVIVEGSPVGGNIFIVNGRNQILTGGNKDDSFIFHWDPKPILIKKKESCKHISVNPGTILGDIFAPESETIELRKEMSQISKPDLKLININPFMAGSINGGRGTDTVDVGGLQTNSGTTIYAAGPLPGTWTTLNVQEVIADFPQNSLTYAGVVALKISNIEKYLGKTHMPDRVTADCNTAFIDGRGGYDTQTQDAIKIPNLNCSYNTTIIIDPHTEVTNNALTGEFQYFIRGNVGTASEIYLEATSKSINTITIQYSLQDLAAIEKSEDRLKFSFVEEFYNRFDNVEHDNSFNLTIANRFEGHTYLLTDSTRIVAGKRNLYAMHKTERAIDSTVEAYTGIAANLNMYLVVQSKNEVLTVTGELNDVLTNDPTSETNHFVGGAGENVYSFITGQDKLTMEKHRINEVIIHYFSKEDSVDRLDLRKIISQVRKDLGMEVKVKVDRIMDDLFLDIYVARGTRDLLNIRLKDVVEGSHFPSWNRKIQIVMDTVFSIEESDGRIKLVPEPLIFNDPSDTLFVINPRDVARRTKIKISKELKQYTFARRDEALIITNSLNRDSHRYPLVTVVLNGAYDKDDDSHCSGETCRKMRTLDLEFDDKTFDLRKEINRIFTAEDYASMKKAVETESYMHLLQAIRFNRQLFALINSTSNDRAMYVIRAHKDFISKNGWVNPLAHAVIEGNAAAAEGLITAGGANITDKDIYGHSPLYYAVTYRRQGIIDYFLRTLFKGKISNTVDMIMTDIASELRVVKYLTDPRKSGASRDEFNKTKKATGATLLHFAAINGNLEVVKYLIKKGGEDGNITAKDKDGRIALYYAVKYNHFRVVDHFIQTIRAKGIVPLSFSIMIGGLDIVKYLIEKKKADLYEKDKSGKTPLYYALQLHTDVADYLIEKKGRGQVFIYAIRTGDIGFMESLMKRIGGTMINYSDDQGKTPLHYAAIYGNLEMVEMLVDGNAIQQTDDSGRSPLDYALKNQHAEVVFYLCGKLGLDPLWKAAAAGKARLVKDFMKVGADLSKTDELGNTLLHVAAKGRGLELVRYLLEKGLSPNARNSNSQTPLHVAATEGFADIVKTLVSAKADVNVQDTNWRTPLDYALNSRHTQVIVYLCEVEGKDALLVAGKAGCTPTVRYLVENGADIKKTFKEQRTLLHLAAIGCHLDLGEYLVNGGIDLNAQDSGGWTPLHLVAQNSAGCTHFGKFLIQKGANLNYRDSWGWTPLFWVVDKRVDFQMLKLLVENGAELGAHDMSGRTPLSLAEGSDPNSEFTRYLKSKTEGKHQRKRRQVTANRNYRVSHHSSTSPHIMGERTQALPFSRWANPGFINWARSLLQYKTDNSTNATAPFSPQIDTNGTIMLLDLLIRRNTGQKYVATTDGAENPLDIQARALNIVQIFEETLNGAALELGMDVGNLIFDPAALQSIVIRQLRIGNSSEIPKTLYSFAKKACSESNQCDEFLENLRSHLKQGLDETRDQI